MADPGLGMTAVATLGATLGAALAAALVYGLRHAGRDDPGLTGAAVKTASVGLLALALWAGVLGAGVLWGERLAGAWPVALGLTLGALGDGCLARPGPRAFLAGMAAFGAGHLAYALGLGLRGAAYGAPGDLALRGLAAAAVAVLAASTEVWLAPRTGALRGPVRAYVLLIAAMALVLVFLPAAPATPMLQAGGALFLLSDLLLALRIFVVADPLWQRRLSRLLWPAYWLGQALIAAGGALFWLQGPA